MCILRVARLMKALGQTGHRNARDKCWLRWVLSIVSFLKIFLQMLHLCSLSASSECSREWASAASTVGNSREHTQQLKVTASWLLVFFVGSLRREIFSLTSTGGIFSGGWVISFDCANFNTVDEFLIGVIDDLIELEVMLVCMTLVCNLTFLLVSNFCEHKWHLCGNSGSLLTWSFSCRSQSTRVEQ